MNEKRPPSNSTVSAVLAKMADLPAFLGMELRSVHDRNVLGETPLHVAAIWGDVEIGKILLDAGADPNVHGEYGYTPLHEAVGQGKSEFVQLLLARGASVELRNDDGQTPRDLAELLNDPNLKSVLGQL